MDILSQYKQQNPEAFREKKQPVATDIYGNEYGTMARAVMRMSGGRIQTLGQANKALFFGAIIIFIVSCIFWFFNIGSASTPRFSEEEAREQMEEYKTIQPF